MQISVENTSAIERRMTIGVPFVQVDSEIEKRLQKSAETARINGFRPGKVPLSVVRKRYGKGIRQEVIGEIMRDSYVEALKQENLNPAGFPSFEPKQVEEGKDVEFVAIFEVYPEIELGDLTDIKVIREETEILEADIDEMIESLRKQSVTWVEKDDVSAQGDKVTLDYSGEIDGEVFEGGTAKGANVEIGSNSMIPGFEDGLVDLKAGDEETLELTFPEDYHADNLQGKDVQFKVEIGKVEKGELPEIDDEFFAKYGVQDGGVEAFHDELKKNMTRESSAAITNKVKQQVVDQLIAATSLEVPSALIKQEVEKIKKDAIQRYGLGDTDTAQLPDELFVGPAENRVKTGLLFAQVVKDNDLKVPEEKVEAKVKELAAGYQDPEQVISYYLNDSEQKQQIESVVLEDVVVEHILNAATVETHNVAYADAIKTAVPAAATEPTESVE